jgi:hypothetical protein
VLLFSNRQHTRLCARSGPGFSTGGTHGFAALSSLPQNFGKTLLITAWHAMRKISAAVPRRPSLLPGGRYFLWYIVPCVLLLRALILPVNWFRTSIPPRRHAPSPWSSGQGLGRWMGCGSLGSLRFANPRRLAPHQFPAVAPPHSSRAAPGHSHSEVPRECTSVYLACEKGGFASWDWGRMQASPHSAAGSSVGNAPFRLKQAPLPASRLPDPCC